MRIVQTWQSHDPDALNLKRPTLRWNYSGMLALHEAASMLATGRKIARPIEDVALVNQKWESDVHTELAHLRYLEDYIGGLTPEQREKMERLQEAPEE